MAQIIKADGTIQGIDPKNGTDFSFEELQGIVGGYVEIVYLQGDEIMVVDEEGKLKGKQHNQTATKLYREAVNPHDCIVGDVLVCNTNQVK